MSQSTDSIPSANVEPVHKRSFPLLLPLLALLLALILGYRSWHSTGPELTLFASQGHGLEVGDPLRYRGVTVGEVRDIELTDDLGRVALGVRLEPEAAGLCREASRFWIVRPHLALESVQGLETIVGARYLSVLPGELDGAAAYQFNVLEEPPVPEAVLSGGLELTLEAPKRFGLAPGAELTYRGVQVGTVLAVELASDATRVEVSVYVRPEYREIVRSNTYFWSTGGVEVSLALTEGLSIELESLRSLLVGGVALATPSSAGGLVQDGARFELHEAAHEDVDEWRPALAVGDRGGASMASEQVRLAVELSWREGRLFQSDRSRRGLGVFVPGGLLLPVDLVQAPEAAHEGSVKLLVAGEEVALEAPPLWRGGGVALLGLEGTALAMSATREASQPEDCLVLGLPEDAPLALSAARMRGSREVWQVDDGVELDAAWNGGLVVARSDGKALGLLLTSGSGARVALFPAELRATWN